MYSLLPESYRFSRIILIFGILITIVELFFTRLITSILKLRSFDLISKLKPKTVVIYENTVNDNKLFNYLEKRYEIIGYISENANKRKNYLGDISRLKEIVSFHKIMVVVYLLKDINTTEIINSMLDIKKSNIEFKILLQSENKNKGSFFLVDLGEHTDI